MFTNKGLLAVALKIQFPNETMYLCYLFCDVRPSHHEISICYCCFFFILLHAMFKMCFVSSVV